LYNSKPTEVIMGHSNKYLETGWRGLAALVVVASPALASTANAAAFNFGGAAIADCSLDDFTYTCAPTASSESDTIAIADHFIVIVTGSGELVADTATLGLGSKLIGNLTVVQTAALGAGSFMEGNLTAGTTVALGADASMTGDILAGTTCALGASAFLDGNLEAGTTVALGASAQILGDLIAGTTCALGASAFLDGNLEAGTTVALGADAIVMGDALSTHAEVTLGANAAIAGTLTAATAATLGADAFVCGDIHSVTATLGADAFVSGNMPVTTATLGANAYVNGSLTAVTVTLGASACYGSLQATTVTLASGAGSCPLPRPHTRCSDDTDGDGVTDDQDYDSEDITVWADTDGDSIPDNEDRCPEHYLNPTAPDGGCGDPVKWCTTILVYPESAEDNVERFIEEGRSQETSGGQGSDNTASVVVVENQDQSETEQSSASFEFFENGIVVKVQSVDYTFTGVQVYAGISTSGIPLDGDRVATENFPFKTVFDADTSSFELHITYQEMSVDPEDSIAVILHFDGTSPEEEGKVGGWLLGSGEIGTGVGDFEYYDTFPASVEDTGDGDGDGDGHGDGSGSSPPASGDGDSGPQPTEQIECYYY
jgi:predicted acyltransferase (DUF342 family)